MNLNKCLFTFCVLVIWAGNSTLGQERPMIKFTPSDGLGHAVVYRITQDRDGIIWFSTDNGLTRYDGETFENFTASDGLGSNFIFSLHQNDTSLLVAAYGQGIAAYHADENRFNALPQTHAVKHPIDFMSAANKLFVVDRDKQMYALTQNGIKPIPVKIRDVSELLGVYQIMTLPLIGVTIAYSHGLAQFDVYQNKFEAIPLRGFPPLSGAYSMVRVDDERVLVAADDGIYEVNITRRNAKLFMKGSFKNHSRALFKDRQGNFWITSLNGELWFCSGDLAKQERLHQGVIINQIFQDAADNVWLATYGEGVFCFPAMYIRSYHSPRGMLVTDLQIYPDLGQPLILSSNFFATLIPQNSALTITDTKSEFPAVLKKKVVVALLDTTYDEVFAAGTYIYRQQSSRIDSIKSIAAVSCLQRTTKGDLLVGTGRGLLKIDSSFRNSVVIDELRQRKVRALGQDANGVLLVGTDDGLFIGNNNRWTRLSMDEGLPNNHINTLHSDRWNTGFWIGTNEGLAFLDQKHRVTTFKHPFARQRCNAIVTDNNGTVWVATNQGLVAINKGRFELYTNVDGFPSDIIKLVYDHDLQRLYALSWNNLTAIDLKYFWHAHRDTGSANLLFKEINFEGQVFRNTDKVNLETSANYATLEYSVPYYQNRKQWRIRYRVNAERPQVFDSKTTVAMYEIPYGESKIVFQIIDFNNQVLAARTLTVYNPIPLVREAWFLIFMTIAFVAAVVWVTRYFVRRKNLQKEMVLLAIQQQMDLEHKALNNMLSPHFLNNAINSIQTFVTRNDQRSTLSYLSKFAKLMRANLELLENSVVPLKKEIRNLELYLTFETLRFEGRLSYEITQDEKIDADSVSLPSLILQPFVENAIWHGILPKEEKGQLWICISNIDDKLYITIDDNGIGILASMAMRKTTTDDKPSRGLAIVEKRFAVMNRIRTGHSFKIIDRSKLDMRLSGTRVEIWLPMLS
ncbi:sensor histidine kinase [Pseudochryseolinea flava]|uniref:Signal transduction histidine kinase internal region domain-containing protein n=1 Tax=Pseudochryseolinea flava TaxID=2059302 RepID=A0A364XZ36_9BACT|nr:two-component regulator propeller domain-containing protein [Pseudochryseolinea flava]RAV98866.1 hypothetical protein DQQ10_21420 [Pseudochryseolinea flava]